MKNKQPWCVAPFGHLNQHAEGHLAPCCAWVDNAPELNNPRSSIREAFDSEYMNKLRQQMLDHDIPDNCIKCVKREAVGGVSNRMSFAADAKKYWPEDVVENPRIVDLDISFSNFCNLKCRMCHSGLSTSWGKDQEQIKHLDYVDESPIGHVVNPPIDPKDLEHIKVLHFKGGEPLLDPQFKTFLNNVDIDNVEYFKITTNGTFFNKDIFRRIARAKKTLISFSVDAVSDGMYRYIRGGRYGIDYAEKNIKQVIDAISEGNAVIKINFTMQAYNLFEFNKIHTWWEDIRQYANEKYKGRHLVDRAGSIGIIIGYPRYLKMSVLPLDFRTRVADELYSDNEAIYKFVTQPEEPGFENFIDYTNRLDKLRNENLLEVEPRFAPLFDQYK